MAALNVLDIEAIQLQALPAARPAAAGFRLSLLPRFELTFEGAAVEVSARSQRVLVFLAIERSRVRRSFVAGTLWPEVSEERASASLRSALWMMPRSFPTAVVSDGQQLGLAPDVVVDYYRACEQVRLLVDERGTAELAEIDDSLLQQDLLAEWSEDWILIEQERYRQMRLHALEALCRRFAAAGLIAQAIRAGLAAVAAEPLRESAHRMLVRAYAAEGNRSEALRQYRLYERLIRDELDLEPSAEFRQLLDRVLAG